MNKIFSDDLNKRGTSFWRNNRLGMAIGAGVVIFIIVGWLIF